MLQLPVLNWSKSAENAVVDCLSAGSLYNVATECIATSGGAHPSGRRATQTCHR